MDIVGRNINMKTLMKTLICTLLLVSCTSTNGKEVDIYKIYYIPLDVNFYVPMLMNQIEEKAHKKIEIKSEAILQYLGKFNSRCKSQNTNARLDIRVKVKDSNNELYISRDEVFVFNGKLCNLTSNYQKEFISLLIRLLEKSK